jgi:hypothetical protein
MVNTFNKVVKPLNGMVKSMSRNNTEFDPNLPFSVVGALDQKAEFDPSQPFTKMDKTTEIESQKDTPSLLESILRGTAQAGAYEYADEATAAAEAALGKLGIVPEKSYEQAKKESREAYRQAQEANPAAYLAGGVIGSVLPALLTGGTSAAGSAASLAAKELPLLAKVGKGAISGVLQGGIMGYGASDAENVTDAISDVGTGAALGGAIGGSLPVVGAGLMAAKEAVAPISKATKKVVGNISGKINELVEESPTLNTIKNVFEASKAGADLSKKTATAKMEINAKEGVDYLQELIKNKAVDIDDLAKEIDNQLSKNPKFKIGKYVDELKSRIKDSDISTAEKNDLRNILSTFEDVGQAKTKQSYMPAGKVLPSTEAVEAAKVTTKLATEKAKLQDQINKLKALQEAKSSEMTENLAQSLDENISKLEQKVAEIDTKAGSLGVEDMGGRKAVVGTISQPSIGDDLSISLGKSTGKALPTDLSKLVGERTPVELVSKKALTNPELGATESRDLQALLHGIGMPESELGSTLKQEALDLAKKGMARGGGETVDEAINIANKDFSKAKTVLEDPFGFNLKETPLSENIPFNKAQGDVASNYENLLKLAQRAGAEEIVSNPANTAAKRAFERGIENLKDIHPEGAAKLSDKLLSQGKVSALADEISRPRLLGSNDKMSIIFGGSLGIAYKAAKAAGGVAKFISELPPDKLKQLGTVATGNTRSLLTRIAENEIPSERRALIFTAMQRPEFRKELGLTEDNDQ